MVLVVAHTVTETDDEGELVEVIRIISARRAGSIALKPITARSSAVGWNVITGVPPPRTRLASRASVKRL